jgi:o-succinylbenzoate synthase
VTAVPPLQDLLAGARVVRVLLRVRFRGVQAREAVLLRGPAGWGEFAPFTEYDDAEAARWLACAVEAGWGLGDGDGGAGWPAPVRDAVPVNATVPAIPADQVAGLLARFDGCRTAKVKVAEAGQGLADDVDRVAAVRDVLGPDGRIRVDANGAWTVDEAVTALRALGRYRLEYAEQPCAEVEGLRALRTALARAGLDVLVAADESVRKAEDPLRVAVAGAADVVMVKVAPLGGVRAALAVAQRLGAEHGLPVVVSSAIDTSVGLAAGVALAAALPELPYDCGLGTASLLAGDVTGRPLLAAGGVVPVRRVVPDDDRMAALAAPAERRDWWLDRLARCHALLRVHAPGARG